MIWAWFTTRLGRIAAALAGLIALIGVARWDAGRDARRDERQDMKDADHERAEQIRRAADGARAGGLHPDDARGYRD